MSEDREETPGSASAESARADVAAADAVPVRPRFEDLPPAAQRALREAEERRRATDAATVARPKELLGRDGPEPVRYGDWELKGIASDF